MEDGLSDDLIRGVKKIAAFIDEDERSTFHKLSKGHLPGGKEGKQWVASRKRLREHYMQLTAGKK